MRFKSFHILIVISLIISPGNASAGQLQDNLEALSVKLSAILKDDTNNSESMADLELSVDIASDDKDTNELKKLREAILELIDKRDLLEKAIAPLKKSLDDDCVRARADKSESAEAIDTLGSCEDAESIYVALTNSTKSFNQSRKNIEINLAKFSLNLMKPTPTPSATASPTASIKSPESAKPAVPKNEVSVAKKITIKCIKGKTTKKVTAINPKCPAGFKKR